VDLIHLHTPNPGGALSLLLAGNAGRLIITHHSDTLGRKHLRRIVDPFVKSIMDRADKIIVTSDRYLDSSEELQAYRDKCAIIPLGIDYTVFERSDERAVAKLAEEYGNRIILTIGRLVRYKGFEYLIRSMKDVKGTLLLIGTGPLQQDIESCIRECGVQNRVQLITNATDVLIRLLYQIASIFVLPSITRAEAFGIVQMEAMASGIPVINTDIPSGVPGVSIHGQTGLTVPPRDSDALTTAINLLLEDDSLRRRFGLAGQQRVREEFSTEKMANRTLKVYETVVGAI
jgi:glycosyltransferase involved in cell wall biosynthesis